MRENKWLDIDYSRYGNSSYNESQLTDKVIAKGLVKYLKHYYTAWNGKWSIGISGTFPPSHDFFQTAEIKPRRFYDIFKNDN
jgi:hypothetical protein